MVASALPSISLQHHVSFIGVRFTYGCERRRTSSLGACPMSTWENHDALKQMFNVAPA
jgi:hypothetical protein